MLTLVLCTAGFGICVEIVVLRANRGVLRIRVFDGFDHNGQGTIFTIDLPVHRDT
jgi:hypothetical protein